MSFIHHPDGKWLEISVTDNGIGVPISERKRIFERFVELRDHRGFAGGHGLGLAFVSETASVHNGWVDLSRRIPRRNQNHHENAHHNPRLSECESVLIVVYFLPREIPIHSFDCVDALHLVETLVPSFRVLQKSLLERSSPSLFRTDGIRTVAIRVLCKPIPAPFPNISGHIVETPQSRI